MFSFCISWEKLVVGSIGANLPHLTGFAWHCTRSGAVTHCTVYTKMKCQFSQLNILLNKILTRKSSKIHLPLCPFQKDKPQYAKKWQLFHFVPHSNYKNKTLWQAVLSNVHMVNLSVCYAHKTAASSCSAPLSGASGVWVPTCGTLCNSMYMCE